MRVIYRHENSILDTNDRRAKFYVNGQLRFMGDSYVAMKWFIQHSDNHPNVLKMFEKQLEQREKPKFTQSERERKQEDHRNKALEKEEEPKKPVLTRRSSRRNANRLIR